MLPEKNGSGIQLNSSLRICISPISLFQRTKLSSKFPVTQQFQWNKLLIFLSVYYWEHPHHYTVETQRTYNYLNFRSFQTYHEFPKSLVVCIYVSGGPPWWPSGEEPPANAGEAWVGKMPWKRKWQPTPVLLPGGLQFLGLQRGTYDFETKQQQNHFCQAGDGIW